VGKFFLKSFLTVLLLAISIVIFLSYFGVETDKFDQLIKSKSNEINKYIKLDFKKTKIHLNPTELNLVVKLQDPKIIVKSNQIILSRLDLFLTLRSFFTSDFLLKRSEIAFKNNDIKDFTKITNIFLPKFINKKLKKIFHRGILEGEFIIPFEFDGSISNDYSFSGKISDASINLTNNLSIDNLITKINHVRTNNGDVFEVAIQSGFIKDIELSESIINLERNEDGILTKSLLRTKGKIDFVQISQLSKILNLKISDFKNINSSLDLNTNINFDLSKRFKVKNLNYKTEGNISNLEVHIKERQILKEYFPEYSSKLILEPCF